ncbi:MAG TPA: pyridoxamine 5'-phosphate oxidase family protein [Rhodocyclaceae bacterium]|nr:pyridoxamine 5'-phosphate oxidase family protein [Rhodocyclaceae bacterium]
MDPAQTTILRHLLLTQETAALGTLHEGQPFVSMVPFAMLPGATGFVIHVSQLASHTQDMLLNPDVSLLVMALRVPGVPAQATARITAQGQALPCPEADQRHAEARSVYLARFPDSEPMFGFADFSLFVIRPTSIRFVGGFAQARTLSPAAFAEVLKS